jgi:hypothetical protein
MEMQLYLLAQPLLVLEMEEGMGQVLTKAVLADILAMAALVAVQILMAMLELAAVVAEEQGLTMQVL